MILYKVVLMDGFIAYTIAENPNLAYERVRAYRRSEHYTVDIDHDPPPANALEQALALRFILAVAGPEGVYNAEFVP